MASDATVTQQAPAERGAHLSHDEVLAAVDALSPEERLKLYAIGCKLRAGTRFASRDLVHEALCRAITGDRHCPKNVPFMAFVVMTMRSIASHDREQRWRIQQLAPTHGEASVAPSDIPANELTPEEHLIEQQSVDTTKQILAQFEDDEEAQLVIMGWADGLRGRELREATGLNQAALDYAIKRVRLRMNKKYPNGWRA